MTMANAPSSSEFALVIDIERSRWGDGVQRLSYAPQARVLDVEFDGILRHGLRRFRDVDYGTFHALCAAKDLRREVFELLDESAGYLVLGGGIHTRAARVLEMERWEVPARPWFGALASDQDRERIRRELAAVGSTRLFQ